MTNKIFKVVPPKDILLNLLHDTIFEKDYYILDYSFYKKLLYNKKLDLLVENLKKYYYKSKSKIYLEKKISYNNFNTIIRHLCNALNFTYIYDIKYNKSNHTIIYYIKE